MFPILALSALFVCLFLLPWRSWDWRRCLVITAVFIPLSLYLYANLGWESGLRAKKALVQFESTESEQDLSALHTVLEQHLKLKHQDALALILKGRLLFAQQAYEPSRAYFKRAYALMPNDPDLMVEYATVLYLVGDEALDKLIQKIQRLEEKPLSAYSLLANVAMDVDDYSTAIENWESMLARLDKANPQVSYIEALILSLKQLDNDARELPVEKAADQS